jgi:hypothetical protein
MPPAPDHGAIGVVVQRCALDVEHAGARANVGEGGRLLRRGQGALHGHGNRRHSFSAALPIPARQRGLTPRAAVGVWLWCLT